MDKSKVDVINTILEECIIAYPVSSFIISLYQQYQKRGWLTKKQMEGLHSKASKAINIPKEKLAALEAIIKKMPTKQKSELPESKPLFQKDGTIGLTIKAILDKYPHHKRVLYLNTKYESNTPLSPSEITELNRFKEVLKI